ncbi:MAG: dihydrofolate reductase [Bacteriovoracaceae bacterium]|nr:dihydrofolate reductase [Bacteriovoracaceae bacterium]
MIVSLVVAIGRNREIGINNELPWNLKDDLANFKKYTLGKPIAMGRKTFESIGRPLPGRENIVLTRNPEWSAEGVTVLGSIDELFSYAQNKGVEELAIIGGDKIFSQTMDRVELMYLTEVDASFDDADAFFPEFDRSNWEEIESFSHPQDERNDHAWTFRALKRKN